jgi:hypothetical protein
MSHVGINTTTDSGVLGEDLKTFSACGGSANMFGQADHALELQGNEQFSFTDILKILKQQGYGMTQRKDVVRILHSMELRVMGDELLVPASATQVAFLLEVLGARQFKVRKDIRSSRSFDVECFNFIFIFHFSFLNLVRASRKSRKLR